MSARTRLFSATIESGTARAREIIDRIRTLPPDPDTYHRDEAGIPERRLSLGSIFSLIPSGRFYTTWTSHQTLDEQRLDAVFWENFTCELQQEQIAIHIGVGRPDELVVSRALEHFEVRELRRRYGQEFLRTGADSTSRRTV